jgi:hypothetical protein
MNRPLAIMPRRGLLTIGASAAPGELLIRPIDFPAQMRSGLALLALERGPEAFVRGAGEIEVILVQEEPGLDDMLAAEFVRTRLQGRTLPEGLRAVAQYAGTWREGVMPDRESVPIEQSLALTYHVIFRNADDSAGRFCWNEFIVGWERLSAAIWRGAEQGLDPSADSILQKDPDFTRERSYLREDRETYRLDVQCAERWIMSFPGVPGDSAALILRNPRSSVWFRLAWTDPDSPTGRGYLLVGIEKDAQPDCTNSVERGTSWRFMTHRTRRLSLKTLAGELQQAESELAADAGDDDPWYDGHRHGHTLIGSPWRGSQLPRERILDIVRIWTGAIPSTGIPAPERPPRDWKRVVQSVLAASFLIGVGFFVWWRWLPGGTELPWTEQVIYASNDFNRISAPVVWAHLEGPQTPEVTPAEETEPPSLAALRDRKLFILSIGISDYEDNVYDLPGAADDAKALMDAFAERSGHCGQGVRACLLQDDDATSEGIVNGLEWLQGNAAGARPESPAAQDLVLIIIACHAEGIGGNYFLLPHDYDASTPARQAVTRFDWIDFKRVFNQLPCKVVVILDTCHAGLADLNRSPTRRKVDFDFMATDVLLQFDEAPPGVVLLQACNGDETAGGSVHHGRFSKALLNALGRIEPGSVDQDEISFLNIADLFQLASEQVVRESNRQQSPRTDVYPRNLNPKVIPAASSMPVPVPVQAGGAPTSAGGGAD